MSDYKKLIVKNKKNLLKKMNESISNAPARNDSSSVKEKVEWLQRAISQARKSGDPNDAWDIVDFLYDTDILSSLNESTPIDESLGASNLKGSLHIALEHYMLDQGFPEDEVDDYSTIDFKEKDGQLRVEIRAELDYEDMEELADTLNPIIQRVDPDSYFDMVDSGIMEAYISL